MLTVRAPDDRIEEARQMLIANGADMRTSGFDQNIIGIHTASPGAKASGEHHIQLRGELLRAVKERVQRGEVRLRKEVVRRTRPSTFPFPAKK